MMGLGNIVSGSGSITSFANKATNSIFTSLGCPSLSSLGLSVGNIVKLLKSDNDEISTEIKDVSLQTSTYNKVIPEIFGQVRIAGNVIWSSEITKTSIYHQQKTTKTGVQSAYTEYLVRGSFAIVLCKGVVDEVKNIYADGELLNLAECNVKIYKGDEEQDADPTMQSYLGFDIPAFRGLCYVVFTEFPLEKFGNRIPNFTFDVIRKKELQEIDDIENLVSAVNIIPGTGEFVYDTKTQKKFNGEWMLGEFYETSKATLLNNHTTTEETDAVDSLNDLCNTFSNLKWVSLVICWFCDNLNSDISSIFPACENNSSKTEPDTWSVDGKTRLNAKIVSIDEDGNLRYGGTPSDGSVIRFAKEIKRRGLKMCLYPMLMVDNEGKPWRGHITGSAAKIHDFFTKDDGYNNFIKHYANLLKDDIDAIIIGSEMKGLTAVYDEINKNYPAVDEFCNLANEIRNIVGMETKITYAADWSEYHHDTLGNYNLDKLWANENIDYIGIDAYFPLTDNVETTYNLDEIQNGWRSGEGWDFYYTDNARTEKESLSQEWAWKNVEYFWANEHCNADGTKTEWIPKSKKIWFTEYGFPSVDCCTNQPNVFYSNGSFDSAFPRYSNGNIDFKAQRLAIIASEKAWQNSECVEEMFLYTWDARPYPYFPNLKEVWNDADCWKYGHFINGKGSSATLANIVNYLCKKVGFNDGDFDTSLLKNDFIDGYILNDKRSVLNHLKVLATAYNFDAYIDSGKIYFKSLNDTQNHCINADNLIFNTQNKQIEFTTEHLSDTNLPSSVELAYIDIDKEYTVSTAIAKDNSNAKSSYAFSAQIPMNISQAQEIAWRVLSNLSNQKTMYCFHLPISFLKISPLDTITITFDGRQHLIRVKSIKIIDGIIIEVIGCSVVANDNILTNLNYTKQTITASVNASSYIANTNFDVFELYNIDNKVNTDSFTLYCAIWSNDDNWNGASIYYSDDNEANYKALRYVDTQTSVGKLFSIKQSDDVSSNFIDSQSEFVFSLFNENEKLQSITDEEFLQMKNKILIGNEIIAFRDVEMLENNVFKISYLLRGRFNTENEIKNHALGERVVLPDEDLFSIDLPISQKGKSIYLKVISNGDSLLNVEAKKITTNGLGCFDFDAKNLTKKMLKNNDILLSFSARKNFKLANHSNTVLHNNLMITIFNGKNETIRNIQVQNSNKFLYSRDMQIQDFGYNIALKDINYKVQNLLTI